MIRTTSLPWLLAWQNFVIVSITVSRCPKRLATVFFELRHVGKLNTRIIWFFMKNRRIVALHGIRNKGQSIPARDLDAARERMRDWRKRVVP